MIDETARFFKKVRITPGCWEWTAAKDGGTGGNQYGIFWGGGKMVRAHRWSYQYHNGPLEGSLFVCHKCDNPLCVNPDHLFLGTASQNTKDMVEKKRHLKMKDGDKGRSKLTAEDVRAIRAEWVKYKRGHSMTDLAKKYGVIPQQIANIIHRRQWREIE